MSNKGIYSLFDLDVVFLVYVKIRGEWYSSTTTNRYLCDNYKQIISLKWRLFSMVMSSTYTERHCAPMSFDPKSSNYKMGRYFHFFLSFSAAEWIWIAKNYISLSPSTMFTDFPVQTFLFEYSIHFK